MVDCVLGFVVASFRLRCLGFVWFLCYAVECRWFELLFEGYCLFFCFVMLGLVWLFVVDLLGCLRCLVFCWVLRLFCSLAIWFGCLCSGVRLCRLDCLFLLLLFIMLVLIALFRLCLLLLVLVVLMCFLFFVFICICCFLLLLFTWGLFWGCYACRVWVWFVVYTFVWLFVLLYLCWVSLLCLLACAWLLFMFC